MQFVGTDPFRDQMKKLLPNLENNLWVYITKNKIMKLQNENVNIVVSDVRFQNEIYMINELGGYIIKVNRPNLKINDSHKSEKNIDKIKNYKYLIKNSSTINDLQKQLINL